LHSFTLLENNANCAKHLRLYALHVKCSQEAQAMKHPLESKHFRAGSAATTAGAIGALAIGAFAIGALAIGRLAIRRIMVGGAKFKSFEIDELTVTRLRVSDLTVSDSLKLPPWSGA
jgi:hypothetical protein